MKSVWARSNSAGQPSIALFDGHGVEVAVRLMNAASRGDKRCFEIHAAEQLFRYVDLADFRRSLRWAGSITSDAVVAFLPVGRQAK
jgi:hypothetical protein